jgi:serine/threonine protein kinase
MPPLTNGASASPDETSSDDPDGQHEYQLRNNAISPVFCSPELCFVQLARDVPMWGQGERPPGVTSNSKFPVGPALDVWAFGVTIWCLLFGRQPWTSDTRYQLFAEIIDEKPQERGFITSNQWPTPPIDGLKSTDTRPAPAEDVEVYRKACDPLGEEDTVDSAEALRIMRGMMVKLVHRRVTLTQVKVCPCDLSLQLRRLTSSITEITLACFRRRSSGQRHAVHT